MPSCEAETPCPEGTFWYCTAGDAINGCSAGSFPYGPCTAQCKSVKGDASPSSTPSPSPVGPAQCSFDAPCPSDGSYYYCQEGKAYTGCSMTPFPSEDCAAMCMST